MKKVFLSVLVLGSMVASAAEVEGIRSAAAVRVDSVKAELVGTGFPVTEVSVQATFGNSCQVPRSEELVSIVNYSKNYDALVISLGDESRTICPAVYQPVTVTIKLGQFTRPNDGTFSKITVNQVAAKKN
jgi:hypothetical protein